MTTTEAISEWVGRQMVDRDELSLTPARGLAALLDRPAELVRQGAPLPAGWHWLYFWPVTPQADLAPDGHARRGGFLPPVPLPRRMWVGGRIEFLQPLVFGDAIERQSTIASVREKDGRTGRLIFVSVQHRILRGGSVAIDETQDLVYREASRPGEPRAGGAPLPNDRDWDEAVPTDPIVLFRFSALTFNGHRIHYDHPYATTVEGYPGLLVHAPLTALLLLDGAVRHRDGVPPVSYGYRAEGPLFGGETIRIAGRSAGGRSMQVWAAAPDGRTAMSGVVDWKA